MFMQVQGHGEILRRKYIPGEDNRLVNGKPANRAKVIDLQHSSLSGRAGSLWSPSISVFQRARGVVLQTASVHQVFAGNRSLRKLVQWGRQAEGASLPKRQVGKWQFPWFLTSLTNNLLHVAASIHQWRSEPQSVGWLGSITGWRLCSWLSPFFICPQCMRNWWERTFGGWTIFGLANQPTPWSDSWDKGRISPHAFFPSTPLLWGVYPTLKWGVHLTEKTLQSRLHSSNMKMTSACLRIINFVLRLLGN